MNSPKTTAPSWAVMTRPPCVSTAIGESLGPNVPMNLKVISGGGGVGVGGGGGQGPRKRGSPQTGGGGGGGVSVGGGGTVGTRKSKMFRPLGACRGPAESRSRVVKIGTSSGLTFFSSRPPRGREDTVRSSSPGTGVALPVRVAVVVGEGSGRFCIRTRASTRTTVRPPQSRSWRRLPRAIFID